MTPIELPTITDEPSNTPKILESLPPAVDGQTVGKVYIETYGCQMNIADSELMVGVLSQAGFAAVDSPEKAGVILLNTCAVRENAETRILGRVGDLARHKRSNPDLIIGVTGCMAEHLKERLFEQSRHVDLVVGPDSYRALPALIQQARFAPASDVRMDRNEHYLGLEPVRSGGVTGWITIMRGCDRFCTFCIVPFTRGREKSVPAGVVLKQVRNLAETGVRQVCLLGQTVNAYSSDGVSFADLLESVAQVDGIDRVRFMSPYPTDFSDRTVEVIARHGSIAPHIHLPLQSGSDIVLKRMRRMYNSEEFMEVVDRLRSAIPDIALTTDTISGFSGETEKDHHQTLQLMKDVRFDAAFMFKYSPREGTFADANLPDDVPDPLKVERLSEVIALQEAISTEIMASRIGKVEEVLVEGKSRKHTGQLYGRTAHFKTVVFPAVDGVKSNSLVKVRIIDSTPHTLTGELEVR